MSFPDARLKHERDRHPELNRPPKVPRPKTATVSQGGSPASTTHHDSGEGWRRSPSANALQNTNDSYSPDFMYHQ
jgi:hypothetical protein